MRRSPSRRSFLAGIAGSAPLLAGCTSDSDVTDSDGDGVIDSEDYAPNDPDVQEKSDLKDAAPTASPSPTPTATATETRTATPTASSTPTDRNTPQAVSNEISVSGADVPGQTFASAYGATSLDATVRGYPEIDLDRAKLLSIAYTFPRGEGVAYGTSEPFTPPGEDEELDVRVDYDEVEDLPDVRLHHLLFAMPADEAVDDVDASQLTHLYETDPFRVTDDRIRTDEPDYFPDDAEESAFAREDRPGFFRLEFDGTTEGKSWSVGFIVWKSAYAGAHEEPRGRGYEEYVSLAARNGIAGELASLLDADAEANDFTGKREKVELVIDFVQSLPYVADDVSKGYDDYPKLVQETIVEAEGDCEDTSILLAAVLQAEPFGYDMVLIQPPEHMAAGIYGTDLPGAYWEYEGRKYYYIETTGEAWGIGDLPEQYADEDAYVHQV